MSVIMNMLEYAFVESVDGVGEVGLVLGRVFSLMVLVRWVLSVLAAFSSASDALNIMRGMSGLSAFCCCLIMVLCCCVLHMRYVSVVLTWTIVCCFDMDN